MEKRSVGAIGQYGVGDQQTSMKGRTLLLLLLVAITPSLAICEVQVFNHGDGLRIKQVNGTGEVSSVV